MKSIKILFIFLTSILFSLNIQAQKDEYVVENNGDTLYGTFEKMINLQGLLNVVFVEESGRSETYKPGELIGYRKDGINYVSKNVRTVSGMDDAFLRVEVVGYINVYSTVMLNEGAAGIVGFEEQYYLEKEGQMVRVQTIGFVPQMKKYYADNPEIVRKIKSRDYLFSNTPAMARAYNKSREFKRDF